MSYIRSKTIKGKTYLYEQKSVRVGKKVKTVHVRYIGKAGASGGSKSKQLGTTQTVTDESHRKVVANAYNTIKTSVARRKEGIVKLEKKLEGLKQIEKPSSSDWEEMSRIEDEIEDDKKYIKKMETWMEKTKPAKKEELGTTKKKAKITTHKNVDETVTLSKKLKDEGFADVSIVENIDKLNKAGYETAASCSALTEDHPKKDYELEPYLSIVIPEKYIDEDKLGYAIFDVEDAAIKNKGYVDKLKRAGNKAGWNVEVSKYMMSLPVIRYDLPEVSGIENYKKMVKSKEWKEADALVDKKLGMDDFMDAIDKRDKTRETLMEKHGGEKVYSDNEKRKLWDDLTDELVKIKDINKKS